MNRRTWSGAVAACASVPVVSIVLFSGACGPSGLDGLVGGTRDAGVDTDTVSEAASDAVSDAVIDVQPEAALVDDPMLPPPRPLAPISVSFLSTLRPRLQWELASGTTGATVEMCRTRACDGTVTTYPADGTELVLPEDLGTGVWFWRLRSRAPGHRGLNAGPTWELVVRGPAAKGSSNARSGAMVDVDGNGEPDLLVAGDYNDGAAVLVYRGQKGGLLLLDQGGSPYGNGAPDAAVSIGGGTDIDGDGFADLVHTGVYVPDGGPLYAAEEFGGGKGIDFSRGSYIDLPLKTSSSVAVAAGGDINGDGYGETLLSSADIGFVGFGAPGEYDTIMLTFFSSVYDGPNVARLPTAGALDGNGDGLSDFVVPSGRSGAPALAFGGSRGASITNTSFLLVNAVGVGIASAFARGDFNGDGLDDLAFTTPVGQSATICVFFGDPKALFSFGSCIPAPTDDTGYGASLTGADLEGDGQDELLFSTKRNGLLMVQSMHFSTDTAAPRVDMLALDFGARLTTIWPGRPGKARWAATAADGHTVEVFEGTTMHQSLPIPRDVRTTGFGRELR